MWPAVTSILTSISCGSGLLMGLAPSEAYLVCSAKVTSRLGALAAVIGSATLRRLPLVQVPQEYEEEPFGGKQDSGLFTRESAKRMSRPSIKSIIPTQVDRRTATS